MKKRVVLGLILCLIFCVACSKEEVVFEECNDIFTEHYFEEVQEIIFWRGNVKCMVDDKEKRAFFAPFSSLTLTEKPTPGVDELLIGGVSYKFIMGDGSEHSVTILAGEIRVDGVFYDVDKNILDELRKIVFGEDE